MSMTAEDVIRELERLKANGNIDDGIKNDWVKKTMREGATQEILQRLEHFRQRTTLPSPSQKPKPDYDNEIRCANCGSKQITVNDKGFGVRKAAAGALLLGPVGLLGGMIGSKKPMLTCLKCGHRWKAGDQ